MRRKLAITLLVLCAVAWPVTSFTVFSGGCENPAVAQAFLGLSWAALILTLGDMAFTAAVRDKQEEGE